MTYPCVTGCLSRGDHDPQCGDMRCPGCLPTPADDPGMLCARCEHRLARWLEDIPDTYALLGDVIEPGSLGADGTGRRGTPAPPAPLRLAVTDATDSRIAWSHTLPGTGTPTDNRRGVLGVLEAWARLVREQRHYGTPTARATITSEAGCLRRNLDWIVQQPWVDELYDEIRRVNRDLSHLIGDRAPRPVTHCPNLADDGQPCGHPLWPSDRMLADGLSCGLCGAHWTPEHLLLLGKVITQEAS